MELLSYQATPHHGHAVAHFHPGPKINAAPSEKFKFKNHPYAFYVHPAISAYKLNKVLYESRFKPSLRQRLLTNAGLVGEEYGLPARQIAALAAACKLSHNNTGKPALDAEPLVELGAHPVGALMAIHVLQAEQRRLARVTL
jgi:hypothetical protein